MSTIPIIDVSHDAITEVQQQFDLARDYVTEAQTLSNTLLTELATFGSNIEPVDTVVTLEGCTGVASPFAKISGITPLRPTGTVDTGGKPVFEGSTDIPAKYEGGDIAWGSAPQPGTFSYTVTPGNLTMVFPYDPPVTPVFQPVDTSGSPDIGFLQVDLPPIDPGSTTYSSSLLTAIQSRLLADVQTDIDRPSVETAKWDRARARDLLTHQASLDAIRGDWSKSGLPLPDGALAAGIESENVRYSNTYDDRSGQIAIEEANLAIQVRQTAIDKGVQLEGILMNFLNTVKERIFQASRAVVEAKVQSYNIIIAKYRMMTDIYQAIVNAKVASQKNEADTFTAEVGAYRAGVDSEVARVGAEVNIYRTTGDLKIGEGKALMDEFTAKVSGWKTEVEGNVARVNAAINKFQINANVDTAEVKARVDKYIADATGYKASIDGQAAKVDAEAKVFSAEIDAFKGDVAGYEALLRFDSTSLESLTRLAVARADLNLKNAELQIQQYERLTGLKLESLKAMGNMFAQQIAGALSGIHAQASMGRTDAIGYHYSVNETVEE